MNQISLRLVWQLWCNWKYLLKHWKRQIKITKIQIKCLNRTFKNFTLSLIILLQERKFKDKIMKLNINVIDYCSSDEDITSLDGFCGGNEECDLIRIWHQTCFITSGFQKKYVCLKNKYIPKIASVVMFNYLFITQQFFYKSLKFWLVYYKFSKITKSIFLGI